MQGARRNGHAREIAEAVFDRVAKTDLCRLNSMGLLALAIFSRDSGNLLRSAGIRRANFRERSRTPRLRKICVPRAIEDVAAQSIGSRRGAHVGFRFHNVCGDARECRCGFCGNARQNSTRSRTVDERVQNALNQTRVRRRPVPRLRDEYFTGLRFGSIFEMPVPLFTSII
jgi:hypothetical protein